MNRPNYVGFARRLMMFEAAMKKAFDDWSNWTGTEQESDPMFLETEISEEWERLRDYIEWDWFKLSEDAGANEDYYKRAAEACGDDFRPLSVASAEIERRVEQRLEELDDRINVLEAKDHGNSVDLSEELAESKAAFDALKNHNLQLMSEADKARKTVSDLKAENLKLIRQINHHNAVVCCHSSICVDYEP